MSYRKTEHFTTLSFPMHSKENFKVQVHTSPLIHHIKTKEPCWRYIVFSYDWNNFHMDLEKQLVKQWSQLNWPRIWSSGGVLWNIKLYHFIMRLVDIFVSYYIYLENKELVPCLHMRQAKWQKIGQTGTENLFCEGQSNWHKSWPLSTINLCVDHSLHGLMLRHMEDLLLQNSQLWNECGHKLIILLTYQIKVDVKILLYPIIPLAEDNILYI